MAYRAGFAGKVVVNTSTTLAVKSWKASASAMALDTTDTASGGYQTFITGLKNLAVTIEAIWDPTTDPYSQTPVLSEGSLVACSLFANAGDTNPVYKMLATPVGSGLYIEKVDVDLTVEGLVKFTISGKSSGIYTPAGS